jgi:hypothetical protein
VVVGNALECVLERTVLERLDPAARPADEMMVMVPSVGEDALVAGDAVADLHALDEAERRERVEHPVDARDTGLAPGAANTVEDLLGRAAAVLLAEVLDHRPAGAALA